MGVPADALERLEAWRNAHKSHSVRINIGDGKGSTCWAVELRGRDQKIVEATEVNLWEITGMPENIVYVADGDSMDRWPGLAATIHAAIDRAERLGL